MASSSHQGVMIVQTMSAWQALTLDRLGFGSLSSFGKCWCFVGAVRGASPRAKDAWPWERSSNWLKLLKFQVFRQYLSSKADANSWWRCTRALSTRVELTIEVMRAKETPPPPIDNRCDNPIILQPHSPQPFQSEPPRERLISLSFSIMAQDPRVLLQKVSFRPQHPLSQTPQARQ